MFPPPCLCALRLLIFCKLTIISTSLAFLYFLNISTSPSGNVFDLVFLKHWHNYFIPTLETILTFPFPLMPKGSYLRNYLHSEKCSGADQQISPHNLTALLFYYPYYCSSLYFSLWSVCYIVNLISLWGFFLIISSACLDAHIFSLSVKIR